VVWTHEVGHVEHHARILAPSCPSRVCPCANRQPSPPMMTTTTQR
jgi:hypothetical protein